MDTIEANLCEALTVADVATAVSVSLFHFSRAFSHATGHGPHDYLMRRRLCATAEELLTTDEKVIDIAFKYQFQAAETFSRAFRRMFGQSPREARASGWIDPRLLWGRPSAAYLAFLAREGPRKPVARRLPALRAAVAHGTVTESAINHWRNLRFYAPDKRTGDTPFQPAIVLSESAERPPGWQECEVVAGDWACLSLPPDEEALTHGRRYLYQTWWPKTQGGLLPLVELCCCPSETGDELRELCLPLTVS